MKIHESYITMITLIRIFDTDFKNPAQYLHFHCSYLILRSTNTISATIEIVVLVVD